MVVFICCADSHVYWLVAVICSCLCGVACFLYHSVCICCFYVLTVYPIIKNDTELIGRILICACLCCSNSCYINSSNNSYLINRSNNSYSMNSSNNCYYINSSNRCVCCRSMACLFIRIGEMALLSYRLPHFQSADCESAN